MASNLFQNMMYQMKDVIGRDVGMLDDTVTVIARIKNFSETFFESF